MTMPVRDARVSINPAGALDPVFTDAAGRFEFKDLAPGRYTLTAEKTGFAAARFGSTNDLDPPIPLEVAAGSSVDGIEIRLAKGAAICGRIVDDLGEPVVGATVSVGLLRMVGTETRRIAIGRPGWQTDDRGEYRIRGLAAGRYYVSVNGSPEGLFCRTEPPASAEA